MNDLKVQFAKLGKKFERAAITFNNHRVLFFFLIASLAVLGALLQSQIYLNPERDEQKYTEGVSEIQYKTINDDAVQQLRDVEDQTEINVEPELVPNRSNPFSE